MPKRKRNYKKEYRDYHGKPEQRKRRSQRNKARRKLGLKKGDPRDASHINAPRKGSLAKVKVKAEHKSKNRKRQPKRGKSKKK